ncbi:Nacetyltransferase [Acanthamoeba castellanii str. Neff]|uniref:Nacetyltransferase n=1 Tax=Acanthamoeba castellanii (strain ATCC 30010 / Neff) TaxID=1257118 RepID=L8HFD0_ACACF|nr:Nacetyltransferase [Acanthamoeba castellanii str. Neff]ELR23458.1 Nacetyltransferase [Acanthamoeba castellanii str. Neff]
MVEFLDSPHLPLPMIMSLLISSASRGDCRRRVGLVAGTPDETAGGSAFSNVGLDDDSPAAAAAAAGGGSGDEGSSVPRPAAPSTPVAVLSRDVWFPSLRRLRVVAEDVAGGSCVVMVATGEEYGHRRRVEQLLAIVNDDLGWNMSNDAPGEEEKIFIFVSKAKQAIGCLVVERVEQAFRVVGEQGDECSTQPEPAVMGISRIWVHEEHRRTGVATKLLDAARAHFVYGYPVRKSECAFTQPTRDGHSLASQYFGLKQFLVYK